MSEKGVIGYYVDGVREQDPSLRCPVLIAQKVLERMGVSLANEAEFDTFVEDLKRDTLSTPLS